MYISCLNLERWYKAVFPQVPNDYIKHFIGRLQIHVDSMKLTSHKRPPFYKKSTKRLSFKTFEVRDFLRAVEEQTEVPLKQSAFFSNLTEIDRPGDMTIDEEIQMAMKRNRWSVEQNNQTRPTTHSTIEVGEGRSRATREIEVVWWPELFPTSLHGKLEIRFFLKKVSL